MKIVLDKKEVKEAIKLYALDNILDTSNKYLEGSIIIMNDYDIPDEINIDITKEK